MESKEKICPECNMCKSMDEFSRDKSRKTGRQTYCKECRKHYYIDNIDKVAEYRNGSNGYYQQWLEFIEVDKLKCSVCGYDKSFAALDYHHNDPMSKDFEIGWFMGRPATEKNKRVLLIELSKCTLLCSNCHRELHAKN